MRTGMPFFIRPLSKPQAPAPGRARLANVVRIQSDRQTRNARVTSSFCSLADRPSTDEAAVLPGAEAAIPARQSSHGTRGLFSHLDAYREDASVLSSEPRLAEHKDHSWYGGPRYIRLRPTLGQDYKRLAKATKGGPGISRRIVSCRATAGEAEGSRHVVSHRQKHTATG